jgi:hypothetical protein
MEKSPAHGGANQGMNGRFLIYIHDAVWKFMRKEKTKAGAKITGTNQNYTLAPQWGGGNWSILVRYCLSKSYLIFLEQGLSSGIRRIPEDAPHD